VCGIVEYLKLLRTSQSAATCELVLVVLVVRRRQYKWFSHVGNQCWNKSKYL